MIGSELLRYKSDQKFLIFDFETNHLNLIYGLPWQVSFMVCDQKQIFEQHDFYVKWDNLNMSQDAARITGFSQPAYQAKAKDKAEVLAFLEKYLLDPSYLIVGHNILGFDVLIHQSWRRQLGLKSDFSYLNRCYDTHCISKAYLKGIKIDTSNLLSFQYKMNSFYEKGLKTNLAFMASKFGVSYNENELHRGDKDILLNWEVLKKLIWSVDI